MNNKPQKYKTPGIAGMDADSSETTLLVFLVLAAVACWVIAGAL